MNLSDTSKALTMYLKMINDLTTISELLDSGAVVGLNLSTDIYMSATISTFQEVLQVTSRIDFHKDRDEPVDYYFDEVANLVLIHPTTGREYRPLNESGEYQLSPGVWTTELSLVK